MLHRILLGGVVTLLREFFEFQDTFPECKMEVPYHCFSPPFFTLSSFVHALWKKYGWVAASRRRARNIYGKSLIVYFFSYTTGCLRTSSFSLKISTARERRARKRASISTSWQGPGTSASAPSSPTPRAKRGWDPTSATGGWRAEEVITTAGVRMAVPRR